MSDELTIHMTNEEIEQHVREYLSIWFREKIRVTLQPEHQYIVDDPKFEEMINFGGSFGIQVFDDQLISTKVIIEKRLDTLLEQIAGFVPIMVNIFEQEIAKS